MGLDSLLRFKIAIIAHGWPWHLWHTTWHECQHSQTSLQTSPLQVMISFDLYYFTISHVRLWQSQHFLCSRTRHGNVKSKNLLIIHTQSCLRYLIDGREALILSLIGGSLYKNSRVITPMTQPSWAVNSSPCQAACCLSISRLPLKFSRNFRRVCVLTASILWMLR